jgi:sugar/nucleoside kinase (ribokinase family)
VQADGTTRMGRPGGNAVYAATAARLWSDTVRVVARRDEDLPTGVADTLERIGVATAFREIPGPTVRNWVIYEADGRRRWLYRTPPARAAEVAVRPGDIPPEWLAGDPAPVVHLAAMPLGAAAALLGHIRSLAPGALITVDSHEGWTDPEAVLELARQADVFVPSREELAQLVGYDDPDRGSRVLRA